MVEQNSGGDCQRQRGGLHGELTLVEQEHHAQQHQHGNKDAHGRRAGRIDLAHELAREREEHAETEQPPAEGRKARPLAAHHGEHHARADQRRADEAQRLDMPPQKIRRYVKRKTIHREIHKQKDIPVDHANHTITSQRYCTPRGCKTLSPPARLFCKKSI